jgi:hypothetical protein
MVNADPGITIECDVMSLQMAQLHDSYPKDKETTTAPSSACLKKQQ